MGTDLVLHWLMQSCLIWKYCCRVWKTLAWFINSTLLHFFANFSNCL